MLLCCWQWCANITLFFGGKYHFRIGGGEYTVTIANIDPEFEYNVTPGDPAV
jgi:hypothetical protein